MAKTNANVQKKGKGSHTRIILALFALIIIAGAYLFFTYGSLPYAVITAKNLNSSTLIQIMAQKINSTAIVNLSYSGSIMINNTDPQLSFFYNKNGSQSWSSLELTGIPNVGDIQAKTHLNQTYGSGYGCVIYNFTSQNSIATPCGNMAYPYSIYTNVLGYLFNLTSIGNVSTESYGLAAVGGQPCYSVSGSGTVMVNEDLFNKTGYAPAKFTFDTCLSAKYNVPLNVEVHAMLNNGASISFNIKNYGMVWYST